MNTSDAWTATQICNGVSIPTPLRSLGIAIPNTGRDDESETKLKDEKIVATILATFTTKWALDAE